MKNQPRQLYMPQIFDNGFTIWRVYYDMYAYEPTKGVIKMGDNEAAATWLR